MAISDTDFTLTKADKADDTPLQQAIDRLSHRLSQNSQASPAVEAEIVEDMDDDVLTLGPSLKSDAGGAAHGPQFLNGANLANGALPRPPMAVVAMATAPVVFLLVVMVSLAVFGTPAGETGERVARAEAPASSSASETLTQPGVEPGAQLGARAVSPFNVSAGVPTSTPINLPAGSLPTGVALDGDRLAVMVEGEDGASIVVYDLKTNLILGEVPVRISQAKAISTDN